MISSILLVLTISLMAALADSITAADLDRKLGPGMKHVSCGVRVTGFYMKRHCKKHFNTTLRCNLEADERRKVKKVAKLCCEDAPSCEPTQLFSEFCCLDGDCPNSDDLDCQPWDSAVEEIELANVIFSSEELFHKVQDRILNVLRDGKIPEFLPEVLTVYSKNPSLIQSNEAIIRRYLKSHRLQAAHIAKSLGIIDEDNKIIMDL